LKVGLSETILFIETLRTQLENQKVSRIHVLYYLSLMLNVLIYL